MARVRVAVAEGAKGERRAGLIVDGFEFPIQCLLLLDHFDIEQRGFHKAGPFGAPAGGDQLFDQIGLDFGLRLEVRDIGLAQLLELGLRLAGQNDTTAGEPVRDRVLGRAGETFGRNGSVGQRSVGARGLDFQYRRHSSSDLQNRGDAGGRGPDGKCKLLGRKEKKDFPRCHSKRLRRLGGGLRAAKDGSPLRQPMQPLGERNRKEMAGYGD